MTNKDRKLAEARKYLDKAEGFSEFSLNDDRVRIGRQRLIMLMKEFAIDYHEAKMREEKAKKFYDKNTCVVCHQNYVDSANGFDTCDYCLNRI